VVPSSDAVIAIELASTEGNRQFRIFWLEQCCWVLLLISVGAEKMKKHGFFPFLNFFLCRSFKCLDSYQLFFRAAIVICILGDIFTVFLMFQKWD